MRADGKYSTPIVEVEPEWLTAVDDLVAAPERRHRFEVRAAIPGDGSHLDAVVNIRREREALARRRGQEAASPTLRDWAENIDPAIARRVRDLERFQYRIAQACRESAHARYMRSRRIAFE